MGERGKEPVFFSSKYSKFKGQVQADIAVTESTLGRVFWNSNKNVPLQPHGITGVLSVSDFRGSGAGLGWQFWYPQVPPPHTAKALVPLHSWSTKFGQTPGDRHWGGLKPGQGFSLSCISQGSSGWKDSFPGRGVKPWHRLAVGSPHPWKCPKPSL